MVERRALSPLELRFLVTGGVRGALRCRFTCFSVYRYFELEIGSLVWRLIACRDLMRIDSLRRHG